MADDATFPTTCPIHGAMRKRSACNICNSAYMRTYLRHRRAARPDLALLSRARERARRYGRAFDLQPCDILIPPTCPVLGIPILVGGRRSENSPSLDRIRPERGYVPGNVRVLSDRANRLKSNLTHEELVRLSKRGPRRLRHEYAKIVSYVEREALLEKVIQKAALGGELAPDWARIATFLDRAFAQATVEPS